MRFGGITTIDITKFGIDNAYVIRKLRDTLDVIINEKIFIRDASFEGDNDYPVKNTGIKCIQVKNPEETKRVIETNAAYYSRNSFPNI